MEIRNPTPPPLSPKSDASSSKDLTRYLSSDPTRISFLPPLPPPVFTWILTRIRSQQETSLLFFNFARSNLKFKPDIYSVSILTHSLAEDSKFLSESTRILESILRSEPVKVVLDSMIRTASNCKDSRSRILSFVLENYAFLRLIDNSLEAFKKIRAFGCIPSTSSCNELLNPLNLTNQFKFAWICYANLIRVGFEPDRNTWSVAFWIFCSQGKLYKAEKLLDLGFCEDSSYDLIIDCYCKGGDFKSAIRVLNRTYENNLMPSFNIYACFIDGGCKFGDVDVINSMLREMIVSGSLPMAPILDYDWVINKLCELGKTFAAKMFFERAWNVKFKLGNDVYANILGALAKEGRTMEAMEVYKIMLQEGVAMSRSCCDAFLSGMCRGEPLEEVDAVLKDLIRKGFVPNVDDLSRYITVQCNEGRWDEAGDILNIVLDKGMLLDAFSCCSLVRYYCANGLVDSATELHEKMKKCGGCLDAISYNVLLEAFYSERRIEEAMQVFEYMQQKGTSNSASFVMMIKALCREKEMRKAMIVHDKMLKFGLKPDDATYRHLISGFM